MSLTVADMKVGERLFLGTYSAGNGGEPISWLKATRAGRFLSEFVLDWLIYDAPEPRRNNQSYNYRYSGSSIFEESNIFQYLNSDEEEWYSPSHEFDEPPGSLTRPIRNAHDYVRHPGFLSDFEPYEVDAIGGSVLLPFADEIRGVRQFELFKRKGIRTQASDDLLMCKPNIGFGDRSFVGYMTRSTNGINSHYEIDRSGWSRSISASSPCGIRPVCDIKPTTKIRMREDARGYEVIPYEVEGRRVNVCSIDDLKMLLGLQ